MNGERIKYCLSQLIEFLSALIDGRTSFVITDAEHIEIYKEDVEALQAAIEALDSSAAVLDNVDHPSHYETNGVECIVAMEAAQGVGAVQDFCICNAFKYIWRHKHKNGAEDIRKAVWYLNKWLELNGKREVLTNETD